MTAETELFAGLDSVPWSQLQVAYGTAERIPNLLRRLASDDPSEVEEGWTVATEQILWHQGTVWPGTVPAARYLVRLAAAPLVRRRPRLVEYLGQLSLGNDEPYSPAGTAKAVRDAIRDGLPTLGRLIDNADYPLRVAFARLAATFPLDLQQARSMVNDLFKQEPKPTTRAALAGALAMLGEWSEDVQNELQSAEQATVQKGVRLPGGITMFVPSGVESYKGRPAEDIVGLAVSQSVGAWIAESDSWSENDTFARAADCVQQLFWDAEEVIWQAL